MEPHEILRHYRELFGLTQKEVAEKIGMTHSGYSKYERGERKISMFLWTQLMPIVHIPTSAISPRDDNFLDEVWVSDYWIEYTELSKEINSKKETMNETEREAARTLFREAYDRIEDEKRRMIAKLQPDKFEEVVKGYGLDYLFDK